MKQLFFIAGTCLISFNQSFAQEQNVIGSSGTFTETASGSVSWTVGEVVIETGTGGSNEVTQGFHQSNIWVVGIEALSELEISIYPNPTSEIVNIVTPNRVKLSIYDMSGRLVAIQDLTDETNPVDVSQMSRGTYNLVFESKDMETKTAQLIVQ